MKRLFIVILAAGVHVLQPTVAHSQGAPDSRAEVQNLLKSFTDATNRRDLNAYVAHYKESQDLVSISDGTILRGLPAIKDMVNEMLNAPGTYTVAVGAVDIMTLTPTLQLVTGPLAMTVKGEGGEAKIQGAMSMLLEKVKGKWRIAHDHYSYDASTATTTPN